MPKSTTRRGARAAAGLTVLCMVAAAPMAANAADSDATGTLSAGSLTNTAPAFTPFTTALTGVNQTVHTAVGSWSVNDATGSNAGYSVTVAATDPEVDGVAADSGATKNLAVVIPGDASAGAYSSTLTYTTAAPVA